MEDIKRKPKSWFQHISANKSELKSEDSEVDENIFDFEDDQPITKEAVASQGKPKEICQNKKGENKLKKVYRKGSILSLKKQKLAI